MTTYDALVNYQKTNVETATPLRLVILLYEGAIRRCREAENALQKQDNETARVALLKAQDIVLELMTTLNMEAGGEIASKLMAQYQYMHRRLVEANISRDAAAVKEVAELLELLVDAWRQIGQQEMVAATSGGGRLSISS